mmetsp:Transcript_447/g.999  ORF Transcript_447/g.999 Transcript_447/m.999 type:complete len:283 (+) Transcript_447:296-1144(+)
MAPSSPCRFQPRRPLMIGPRGCFSRLDHLKGRATPAALMTMSRDTLADTASSATLIRPWLSTALGTFRLSFFSTASIQSPTSFPFAAVAQNTTAFAPANALRSVSGFVTSPCIHTALKPLYCALTMMSANHVGICITPGLSSLAIAITGSPRNKSRSITALAVLPLAPTTTVGHSGHSWTYCAALTACPEFPCPPPFRFMSCTLKSRDASALASSACFLASLSAASASRLANSSAAFRASSARTALSAASNATLSISSSSKPSTSFSTRVLLSPEGGGGDAC